MSRAGDRWSAVFFVITALLASQLGARASDSDSDSDSEPGPNQRALRVEHAEIVPDLSNDCAARAYLTLFNSGSEQFELESVDSDILGKAEMHQTTIVGSQDHTVPILSIPRRAELTMRADYVHLCFSRSWPEAAAPRSVRLSLAFRNISVIAVDATVMPMGSKPTHHDHREPE